MEHNKSGKDSFTELLKHDKAAEAYFNSALEDCKNLSEEEGKKHLVQVFKNIAAAHGKLYEWVSSANLCEGMISRVVELIYKTKVSNIRDIS